MNPRWLLRMSRWARNPPPMRRVIFVLGIAAVCIAVALVEWLWGWPAALTLQGGAKWVRP